MGQEGIDLPIGEHRIDGGILSIRGPPVPLGTQSRAAVYKPTYSFIFHGTEWNATEACAAYLALLEKRVAQFEADSPCA